MEGMKKSVVFMIWILALVQLTSCAVLPKEEEYNMGPLIKDYEGMEYDKVKVRLGDVVEKKVVYCNYSSSTREDVSFYYTNFDSIYRIRTKQGKYIVKKNMDCHIDDMLIQVKQGDTVKKGDVLIEFQNEETENIEKTIEDIEYEVKLNLLKQKQNMEIRDLEIEKQKKLSHNLKSVKATEQQYNAELNELKSNLTLLKMKRKVMSEQRKEFFLTAGIDGKVTFLTDRFTNPDPKPELDMLVCTIADTAYSRFIAETEYAASLKDGWEVVVLSNDIEYPAVVSHPKNMKNVVYFDLLQDSSDTLRMNDPGTVDIMIHERKDVRYLPDSAVKHMGDKTVVFYEDENGLKVPKEVEIGLTAAGKTEIIRGLDLNEEVILN